MDWKKIKDEKPDELIDVLVAQDCNDDHFPEYFIARYWARENRWLEFLSFPGKNSPFIEIERKVKKNDQWTMIDEAGLNF